MTQKTCISRYCPNYQRAVMGDNDLDSTAKENKKEYNHYKILQNQLKNLLNGSWFPDIAADYYKKEKSHDEFMENNKPRLIQIETNNNNNNNIFGTGINPRSELSEYMRRIETV